MISYIIILFIIIVSYAIISVLPIKKNKTNIFINISFLELLVFLAIRDVDVGPDMVNYIANFKYISKVTIYKMFALDWEPLFIIFNKILSFFTTNNQFYIIITSF